MKPYRASRHVVLGVPDENAYNMFLSVMAMCTRLGLWSNHISWKDSGMAYHRLTNDMQNAHIKRKRSAAEQLQKA